MKNKPTESELEILQVLWKEQPCTVRDINERINENRTSDNIMGYTTTLKLMQIMTKKGLLFRTGQGRKHIYTAAIKEKETQSALLDKFLNRTFGGSAMKLVMQALGNHKTSQAELEEIKALIQKIENEDDNE